MLRQKEAPPAGEGGRRDVRRDCNAELANYWLQASLLLEQQAETDLPPLLQEEHSAFLEAQEASTREAETSASVRRRVMYG